MLRLIEQWLAPWQWRQGPHPIRSDPFMYVRLWLQPVGGPVLIGQVSRRDAVAADVSRAAMAHQAMVLQALHIVTAAVQECRCRPVILHSTATAAYSISRTDFLTQRRHTLAGIHLTKNKIGCWAL